MAMDNLSTQQQCRLRGVVLELVYDNHRRQGHRLDHVTLWGALDRLHFDVGRFDVLTILQDLGDRGYLRFRQDRDKDTNRVAISSIEILPKGRDLVEKINEDAAVTIL